MIVKLGCENGEFRNCLKKRGYIKKKSIWDF